MTQKRKNRYVTDLKYDSRRQIDSVKGKIEGIAAKWGDVDFFIMTQLEDILGELDEIKEQIKGLDVSNH